MSAASREPQLRSSINLVAGGIFPGDIELARSCYALLTLHLPTCHEFVHCICGAST
jgi:hypothetical protein